ncbi:MAG: glycosyltransferase [Deltaproteobacteria bacterium]|nr:MAG: glycosyltransferase [Deltaproteobacteria bacterium]
MSVVIPTLDEEAALPGTIRSCREAGECELVVADGGSADRTLEIARGTADAVVSAPRGRALQMNAGAAAARGGVLLFLHADTLLPPGGLADVSAALEDPSVVGGAFRVELAASPETSAYVRAALRIAGGGINLRSRLTRSYTGDQAIFLRAAAFGEIGGFPRIPLMEDVELSRRMTRIGKTVLLAPCVRPSGRRWEEWGPAGTIALMWRLRVAYLCGRSPGWCAERYRGGPARVSGRRLR